MPAGYTSVSPGIVLGGNHPIGSGGVSSRIKITVCNVNLCSGISSCTEFWIDRPYPCEEGGGFAAPPAGGDSEITPPLMVGERSVLVTGIHPDEISIYPNPTSSGMFYLTCPVGISGQAILFDYTGKLIGTKPFGGANYATSLVESPLEKGVYFLQIKVANENITKKIVVQ